MLESLFNEPCNFIKKRLQYRCYPVKFAKIFKNTFFYRTPPVPASLKTRFCFIFLKYKENIEFYRKALLLQKVSGMKPCFD